MMPHGHSPEVHCVVSTCTHYVPGDLCSAYNIDILYEEEGRMAQNSEQTECKTYEHRRGLANMLGSMDNVNVTGAVTELFTPGVQLTPSVTCTVESCKYWDQGNLCGADEIDVSGQHANECADTNCATYLPNNE